MNSVVFNKKLVITSHNFTCFILAITIFLSIDPFFAWSSFAGGIGVTLFKAMQLLAIALMAARIPWKNMPVNKFFCAISVFCIFLFYCFFTGVKSGTTHPLLIGNILIYLFYALTVMTDNDILVESFGYLRTIFAIILGYTLIIHILLLLHVPLPCTVLQSGEAGRAELTNQYYQNFLGCLLIYRNGIPLYRFTSVFTEPGVVGTFCAFFLAASDFNIRKSKIDKIFLISGILSLSVAFFLMLVVIYVMKSARKGAYKFLLGFIGLLLLYSVFINVKFSDPSITELQERLTITEDGLSGDNRMDEEAEAIYQNFLKGDLKTVLFGYGYLDSVAQAAAWQKTTSYKESVYCLGVLGYGIMVLWFILAPLICYKSNNKKKNYLMYSYIIVFIASQYQRPYMKSLFLAYILLAGCLYIRQTLTVQDNAEALTGRKSVYIRK